MAKDNAGGTREVFGQGKGKAALQFVAGEHLLLVSLCCCAVFPTPLSLIHPPFLSPSSLPGSEKEGFQIKGLHLTPSSLRGEGPAVNSEPLMFAEAIFPLMAAYVRLGSHLQGCARARACVPCAAGGSACGGTRCSLSAPTKRSVSPQRWGAALAAPPPASSPVLRASCR